jgi:hypothetical protein
VDALANKAATVIVENTVKVRGVDGCVASRRLVTFRLFAMLIAGLVGLPDGWSMDSRGEVRCPR